MFYDERIELQKGRICRNSIFLAWLLAVIVGTLRLGKLLLLEAAPKHLVRLLPEMSVLLMGLITGLVTLFSYLLSDRTDERLHYTQSRRFNAILPCCLCVTALVFSLGLPITLSLGQLPYDSDQGYQTFFAIMLYVISAYVLYAFKKSDIYFNYSFIDSDHYYRQVLRNCGKLILAILSCCLLSLVVLFLYNQSNTLFRDRYAQNLVLKTLKPYLHILLAGLALYWVLSFLERESYRKEHSLSKATGILLMAAVALTLLDNALSVLQSYLLTNGFMQLHMAITAWMSDSPVPGLSLLLNLFVIYYAFEYPKLGLSRGFTTGCRWLLVTRIAQYLTFKVLTLVRNLYIPAILDDYDLAVHLSQLQQLLQLLSDLSYLVGLGILVVALMKDKVICRAHTVFFVLPPILTGITFFFMFQADLFAYTCVYSGGIALAVIYICYLIFRIIQRSNTKGQKNPG